MTQPASDLAQNALEFCRECLGWENPVDGGKLGPFVCPIGEWFNQEKKLWYRNLNAVMVAVRGWLRSSRLSFKDHHALQSKLAFQVQEWLDGMADKEWLCLALLAACVEASRKFQ